MMRRRDAVRALMVVVAAAGIGCSSEEPRGESIADLAVGEIAAADEKGPLCTTRRLFQVFAPTPFEHCPPLDEVHQLRFADTLRASREAAPAAEEFPAFRARVLRQLGANARCIEVWQQRWTSCICENRCDNGNLWTCNPDCPLAPGASLPTDVEFPPAWEGTEQHGVQCPAALQLGVDCDGVKVDPIRQ